MMIMPDQLCYTWESRRQLLQLFFPTRNILTKSINWIAQ
jgi:hypothetical protein